MSLVQGRGDSIYRRWRSIGLSWQLLVLWGVYMSVSGVQSYC